MSRKIHILGAAGSGVTTLGRALSEALNVQLLDTDDFYWRQTPVPFSEKTTVPERLFTMREACAGKDWIISGSLMGWGEELVEEADLLLFVYTPTAQRMKRLREREIARYGDRIREGGDMYLTHECFMGWASRYDNPRFAGRSRRNHMKWIKKMGLPVAHLDGRMSVHQLTRHALTVMQHRNAFAQLDARAPLLHL